MPGRVGMNIRKERSRILRELSNRKRQKFYQDNAEQVHNVLFETIREDDHIYGFTENYVKVRTAANASLENTIFPFEITTADSWNFAEGRITG